MTTRTATIKLPQRIDLELGSAEVTNNVAIPNRKK